ncbi:ssl1498 family light-harvesting-like protein [Cronbergia sp. UHCC 0137]|uniref:photosystem II assembly protein Psb34 n=1 Tax=Cronbergia sp. UHCC 0137 TaxID=3110239 RepID=UPI002B1F6FA6|nr:ssl1498 family light-harvesting-like protein [Cronbergia sp. UHCC 0137]MEA5620459.1 ssl1498 family light-harvesting-like protein [Cronbergia sp. UHCC 0137]
MPYTNEEGGRLNNFASEPKVYKAEPPTNSQKRNYIILGILAASFVSAIIFVAFSVSNVSS